MSNRSNLLSLSFILLLLALAATASAADPECHTARKGQRWQTGKLVKVLVSERSEGGPGAFFPPQAEGAPPAASPTPYGQVLDLTVTTASRRTYAARCAVGTLGCDPAGLSGESPVSFLLDGKTLVVKRADGHLLCARVAER